MMNLIIIFTFVIASLILASCLMKRTKKDKKSNPKGDKMEKLVNDGLTYQTSIQFKFATVNVGSAIETKQPYACQHSFKMNIKNEPNKIPNKLARFKIPKGQNYGVSFPINDEDLQNPPWYQIAVGSMLNIPPITDKDSRFPEDVMNDESFTAWEDNTVGKIYKSFKHTFIHLQDYDITSDKGISLMSFNGLGCHYMKKIDRNSSDDDTLKTYEKELESAVYMIDLRVLGQFPVREGFVRYGCSAYYNNKYEIIGIFASHYKKLYTPTSDNKEWEHAKWILRVTIATVSTIKDHLLESHEIIAHAFVISTREYLPFNHPIRRFLKPFCFRTIYINHSAAQNLVGKKQLVHRAWAFNYDEVNGILNALNSSYKFDLHKNIFKKNGMADVPDEHFPIQTDMNEYWEITHEFVTNYMKIYYPTDEALNTDKYIPDWYSKMCDGLKLVKDDTLRELKLNNVIDMICNKIVNGSAWHQYVGGTIQEYLKRPYWFGSKIRDNFSTSSDIQSFVQAITIGLFTGLPMPDIVNDWKFVLLKDDKYSETTKIFDNWQDELKAMSQRVNERNLKRAMPIKFCDPVVLDVSVGI